MNRFHLLSGCHVAPTPAGAFYACAAAHPEPARQLLQALLRLPETPRLEPDRLRHWSQSGEKETLQLLWLLQEQALIQGLETPRQAPDSALEKILPGLLEQLSAEGRALLADGQGLYMASAGLPHETADELAALSAGLGELYERHQRLLHNNLACPATAWALSDAAGNSQLGFWPLFIGEHRFSLVITGMPHLERRAFTDLVWLLSLRYGR